MKHSLALVWLVALASSCGLFTDKKESGGQTSPLVFEGAAPIILVVPHEELTRTLPQQLEGWHVELPPGVVIDNGAQTLSRARANYWREQSGESESFNLEIVDGTHVPSVQVALAITAQSDGDSTLRPALTVGGYRAHQRWGLDSQSVTVTAVIAKRFVVTLKGTNVDADTVRRIMNAVDVKRLEALAGVDRVGDTAGSEPQAGVVGSSTAL